MSKNLLDLSGKIDTGMVEIFEAVSKLTSSLNIPYFVVGARARDLVLYYGYGIETIRATMDIDFGIKVSVWEQFNQLKNGLIASGEFSNSDYVHRIVHKTSVPIDIIPFGKITRENSSYSWPPDHNIEMNVLGFNEAFNFSIPARIRTNPNLDVPLASPAGLAMLKIISWNDEKYNRLKDAQDLFLLIRNHIDIGNEDRFYKEIDTFQFDNEDFDYELASSQLLGRDIASICVTESINRILQILERETNDKSQYKLVSDMMKSYQPYQNFEYCLGLLKHLRVGINYILN